MKAIFKFCLMLLFTLNWTNIKTQSIVSKQIKLEPGKETVLETTPLSNGICLIKFEPDLATAESLNRAGYEEKEVIHSTKNARSITTRSLSDQKAKDFLNIGIKSGNAQFKSEKSEDNFSFTIKTTNLLLLKGQIVIKNVSSVSVSGEVRYIWRTNKEHDDIMEAEITNKVRSVLDKTTNTDMLYIVGVLFDRYSNNYPQGKGEIDMLFDDNLKKSGVSPSTVKSISSKLKKYQTQINSKVLDKSLLGITQNTKINSNTIKLAKAITETQKSESNFIGRYTHSLDFVAIKSHRCADDVGWEWGCDLEEGYVGYYCFGPNIFKYGATSNFNKIKRYREKFITTNIFNNERLEVPLVFMYQVIEDDPEGPSKEQMYGAIWSAIQATAAGYMGNWEVLIKEGLNFLISTIEIVQAITSDGDDVFPIYLNVIDENRLKAYTLGTSNLPEDKPFFESEGNYSGHYTIRIPKIIENNKIQWSLAYTILGRPIGPIVELYADINYGGNKKFLYIDGNFGTNNILPIEDNQLSSIKIVDPNPSKYEIVLYDNTNRVGASRTIYTNFADLGKIGFDNKTSSIAIRKKVQNVLQ